MVSNIEILTRLALACVLGGLIGIERERNKHPAGLRTHVLVCISATLVMLCNIYIFEKYKNFTNVDPARLGAQVISGIGFLGAGTIIKEGVSVRGLTTAASLWAVACLGIAVGLGFYAGAVLATSFILIILITFSKFEFLYYGKSGKVFITAKMRNKDGNIELITSRLREFEIYCNNVSVQPAEDDFISIKVKATVNKSVSNEKLLQELYKIEGINYIKISD